MFTERALLLKKTEFHNYGLCLDEIQERALLSCQLCEVGMEEVSMVIMVGLA